MKTIPLALLLTVSVVASGAARADEALAKAKNCMACHTVDRRLVGPSYREVAKKYAAQKGADAQLAEKIVKGSKGAWGAVPMPPNATVKPDEANRLARWILGLK